MKTEFLKGLELSDEVITKIMVENGKDVEREKSKLVDLTKANDTLNEQLNTLNTEMQALKDSNASAEDYKSKFETLQADIAAKDKEAQEAQADKELTEAITAVFGDKKFTSDYVKNGIITDMKAEISKPENKGKGYSEVFETLTKDKSGLFESVHPASPMGGFENINHDTLDDKMVRSIMGLSPEK